jgi:hypothetical protein
MVYRFKFDVEVAAHAEGATLRTTVPQGDARPDGRPDHERPERPAPVPMP